MNLNQVKQYCKALGIRFPSNAKKKGWVQLSCPLAEWRHQSGRDSSPSFGIRVKENGMSDCHCFSCGFHGDLYDLAFELITLTKNDPSLDFKKAFKLYDDEENGTSDLALAAFEEEDEIQNPVYYFSSEWLRSFPSCLKFEDALAYNESRGMPRWMQEELDLRFDSHERRVCFPVRDFEGNLVGLHGRQIDGEEPVYRMYTDIYPRKGGKNNPAFWYGEDKVDLDEPLVVVESVYDYTRVYEVYKNVICPLTASLTNEKIERLQDALYLIKIFDGDKAGRKASAMLKEKLPHIPQKNVVLPEDTDPGKMSVGQMRKLLKRYIDL